LYDLFTLLDPIFNFAKYVMQVSFFYPLPWDQKNLIKVGRKKRQPNALARNHMHI
jgi:hypothetical protein